MAREIVNRQVNIYIQSGEAQKAYDTLIRKEKELNAELAKTTDPKKMARLRDELKKLEEPLDRAARKVRGELEPSLRDTQATVTKLRNELSRMSESDPKYKEKINLFRQGNTELETQRQKVGLIGRAWKSFWSEAKTVAAGVIIGNTLQAALETVLGYVTGIVTGSAKIADELSDIEKTTGLTNDQVRELNRELGKIDTRTSRSELRKLAAEGGKLGFETTPELLKFVDAADKIRVALKEDLGEGAIIDIAKASKIFGVEMLNMASAINEIGAASTASEAFSVDFIKRTGGVAATVKIAAGDILGYSSAIEQAGLTSEVATTALNTFFLDFVSNIEKFGQAAGFARGELAGILGKDGTNEAFLQFLERLKIAQPSAAGFITALKDLGIDGARGSNVMLTLAENIGEVRKQQDLANGAIASTNSIMTEFNKKNNNAAAALDKFKKNVAGLFQSESFLAAGEKAIHIMNGFINILKASFAFIREHGGLVATLGTLYALLVVRIRGASIAQVAHNLATKAGAIITNTIAAAQALYVAVTMRATTGLTLARRAQMAWNAAASLGAGPLGILVVSVGALIVGLQNLVTKTNQLTAAQRLQAELAERVQQKVGDQVANVELLTRLADDETASLENRKQAIEELIRINPAFANTLSINAAGHLQGKSAIDEYVAALYKQAEAEAKYALVKEKIQERDKAFLRLRRIRAFSELGNEFLSQEVRRIGTASSVSPGESSYFQIVRREAESLIPLLDDIEALRKDMAQSAASTTVVTPLKNLLDDIPDPQEVKAKGDDLTDELQRIAQELQFARLLPMERELAEARVRFEKLHQQAGSNYKLQLSIFQLHQEARLQIIEKYAKEEADKFLSGQEKKLEKEDALMKKNRENLKKVQARLDAQLQQGIADAETDRMARKELAVLQATGKEKLKAQLALLKQQMQQELSQKDLTENQKLLIEEKYRRARQDAEKTFIANQVQQTLQIAQAAFDLFSVFANARTEKENIELEADRARNDAKKRNLENRLKAGLISQLQYQRELDKLDNEQARKERKIRREQFERDKRARIIQAIMNGAQAITTIWATTPKADFGIAQQILIGLSIASTLAQIATISKQKAPEYARGGRLGGRTHAQGGNPILDGNGRKIAEIEAGEGIINRRSMGDRRRYSLSGTPSQIASRLNSLNGWGVSWEGGARLEPRFAGMRPVPFNMPNIRRYYATGGRFAGAGSGSAVSETDPALLDVLQSVGGLLASLQANGIKAYSLITEQEKQQERLDTIRREATMRP